MKWVRMKFLKRSLRYWLHAGERQRLLWEEMEFHIESMTQELTAQGMSEADARAAAHRKFGNMTQTSEQARGVWLARWWSDLVQDLRQSFRGMRRDAGFTAFTILIAGLGIGASATVFSIVNALLLRPLPFHDPARLVWIANEASPPEQTNQVGHLVDLSKHSTTVAGIAGYYAYYRTGDVRLSGGRDSERLTGVKVTQNFFPLL